MFFVAQEWLIYRKHGLIYVFFAQEWLIYRKHGLIYVFFAQEWLIYRKHGLIYVFCCPRMVDLQETWVDLCFLLPKNG